MSLHQQAGHGRELKHPCVQCLCRSANEAVVCMPCNITAGVERWRLRTSLPCQHMRASLWEMDYSLPLSFLKFSGQMCNESLNNLYFYISLDFQHLIPEFCMRLGQARELVFLQATSIHCFPEMSSVIHLCRKQAIGQVFRSWFFVFVFLNQFICTLTLIETDLYYVPPYQGCICFSFLNCQIIAEDQHLSN